MLGSLIHYFDKELNEELGHLGAELLLRHILREIGPAIYNAGVKDAARYMQTRLDDISEVELIPPRHGR